MHEDIGRCEEELDRETKNFEKFSKQVADGNKAIEKLNRKLKQNPAYGDTEDFQR